MSAPLWVLIANPHAGLIRRRGRGVFTPLEAACAARGIRLETEWSESSEDGALRARAAAARGAQLVIAAGGDGTINRVAEGLVGTRSALGFIPGGTVNVLARATALPLDPKGAFEALLAGGPRPFWPGRVNGRLFLEMAGIGLDAAIVAATDKNPGLKKKIGRTAYPLTALLQFKQLPRPGISGHPLKTPAQIAAIGRVPLYGGQFALLPDAETHGRRLGLFALHDTRRRALLPFVGGLMGRGGKLPASGAGFTRGHGEAFSFTTDSACDFQVDGEWAGQARRFEISVPEPPLKIWLPGA